MVSTGSTPGDGSTWWRRWARRDTVLRVLGFVLAWLVVAVPAWVLVFTHSSSEIVLASHDAVVHPTLDGEVRLDLGPYLPDLRTSSGGRFGVAVELGKTTASSAGELAERYAAIAAHPEAEQGRVEREVVAMARDAALWAAGIGLVPVGLWLLLGSRRRAELTRRLGVRTGGSLVAVTGLMAVLVVQPWQQDTDRVQNNVWIPLQTSVPDVPLPDELAGWEIQGGLVTKGTQRLLLSLVDTYDRSKVFYAGVVDRVDSIAPDLRKPAEDETVAVLVSDRHDNIGMDQVVRAVADEAGATAVLTAGDDTSTGEPWEEFSLESLDSAFEGYDAKVAVAGNHDNGPFVSKHLASLGWTHLEGEPEDTFGDVRITGVDDPRSSGLGTWRDETDLSFGEVEERIADDVCKLDEEGDRIATLLVHDANLGRTALARGCTDLVVGGHVHARIGPDRVVGENGKVGYSYTNGTTGGAAYAIAIGSKLRRDAMFTFITYRDGRPVGIQPVTVGTRGNLSVADFVPLDLEPGEGE